MELFLVTRLFNAFYLFEKSLNLAILSIYLFIGARSSQLKGLPTVSLSLLHGMYNAPYWIMIIYIDLAFSPDLQQDTKHFVKQKS